MGGWFAGRGRSTLVLEKYSEDQPRDEQGRFASTGSLGTRALERGGFSVSAHGGTAPTTGFMVSLSGSERTKSLEDLGAPGTGKGATVERYEAATAAFIGEFRAEFASRLAEENAYLGGWIDGGKLYLDVSVNVDTKEEAVALGKEHEQLAVYDVEKDEYVDLRKGAAPGTKGKVLIKVSPEDTDEDIAKALLTGLLGK